MDYSKDINRIKSIFALKEELEKNIELKERLISTKDSIAESTFYEYLNTYSNTISRLEVEIRDIEQIIGSVRLSFQERKQEINQRALELEKVIGDTNILYQSKSIDEHEYKRRKKENDLNLNIIEQENKSIHNKLHQFESLLFQQKGHKSTPYYHKASNKSGMPNTMGFDIKKLPQIIQAHKKAFIIGGSAFVLLIVGILSILAGSGYLGWNTEAGLSSSYQKRYPIRVPVVNNGLLYGFADESGILVVDAQFEDVRNFSEGYAAVKKNGLWGYIDSDGTLVVAHQYQSAGSFSEEIARVGSGGKFGFIDSKNNIVIPISYERGGDFKHGLAPVKQGNSWGYVDSKNNVVIDFIYEAAYTFRDDPYAVVKLNGAEGLINTRGDYILAPNYDSVKAYADGLAAVFRNGSWSYIDTNGNFVIDNKYREAYNFNDGLAVVKIGNNFNIIDSEGGEVKTLQNISNMFNLGSSMFRATSDGKLWYLIDAAGDVKFDNKITIAPIDMYGNGAIFRVKTPYGFTLYDYSFSLLGSYYFPYTGVYKFDSGSEATGESNGYYFFIWYKEESRKYYGFCVYIDDYSNMYPHFAYSILDMKNGSFKISEQTVVTNLDYNFYTDAQSETITTNSVEYDVRIDGDVLAIGETYFNRIYSFENTNNYNSLYSNEINRY